MLTPARTTVLAQDLLVGDLVLATGFGGCLTEPVSALRIGPGHVHVEAGSQRLVLGLYEACVIARGQEPS